MSQCRQYKKPNMSLERKECTRGFGLACPQTWTDYFLAINTCNHQRPVAEFKKKKKKKKKKILLQRDLVPSSHFIFATGCWGKSFGQGSFFISLKGYGLNMKCRSMFSGLCSVGFLSWRGTLSRWHWSPLTKAGIRASTTAWLISLP